MWRQVCEWPLAAAVIALGDTLYPLTPTLAPPSCILAAQVSTSEHKSSGRSVSLSSHVSLGQPSNVSDSWFSFYPHRLVRIGVSSGSGGWGLKVEGCPGQSCATLPPPHQQEKTQKGVSLSVLNQRDASLVFHKVSIKCQCCIKDFL